MRSSPHLQHAVNGDEARRRHPGPWLAKLLRAPGRLYDWDLGWVLGRRFLRLTHVGRRSGRRYRTMLEVVGENRDTREVIVLSGLGRGAQWYRNLEVHEALEVAIGRDHFVPVHRELGEAEAAAVLAGYERRNRFAASLVRVVLSRLVGWRYQGADASRLRLVRQLPMIAFAPAGWQPMADAGQATATGFGS